MLPSPAERTFLQHPSAQGMAQYLEPHTGKRQCWGQEEGPGSSQQPCMPQQYQDPAQQPGFPEEGAGLPLLCDLGLSVTFSISPGSLVHQRSRSAEGLFVSLSRSHCNMQPSPAGTQSSEAAGPCPGTTSPVLSLTPQPTLS